MDIVVRCHGTQHSAAVFQLRGPEEDYTRKIKMPRKKKKKKEIEQKKKKNIENWNFVDGNEIF